MNKSLLKISVCCIIISLFTTITSNGQKSLKSILINHGSTGCGNTDAEQQLFTGIMSGVPSILTSCSNGIPFYNAFTAYNPKDKKIYFADISDGNSTKMYAMDYNLSGVISCMTTAAAPTYKYAYGINQLCFDADGNNLAIYNYDASTGKAAVKRIEVATGDDIAGTSKPLDFPISNAPSSLSWGDMVFMPNGRIFMTFGNTPSKLFELVNFDGPGDATAIFLMDIPRPCFSIGYVDGNLMIAGSDGGGCYYYLWDINSFTLSSSKNFPMGKSTADMTHMNVGIGASQELIGGSVVNGNTADIIYHIVIKNKGNIDISNVQLRNKLTDAFGIGNVSNVHASFVSDPAGLALNPLYDGVLNTDLLLPGQSISNYPISADSAVIRISFRATNLIPSKTYYSSALTAGQAGAGQNILSVSDSSNNGAANMIDMDANGVSDDMGEGVPTPFMYNVLLPLNSLDFTATEQTDKILLQWKTSNDFNGQRFVVERSTDASTYNPIAVVAARAGNAINYQTVDNTDKHNEAKEYYRLKVVTANGNYSYSKTLVIDLKKASVTVSAYPNPFISQLDLRINVSEKQVTAIKLFDCTGKLVKIQASTVQPGLNHVIIDNLQVLTKGIYYLEVTMNNKKTDIKIIK